ncbi:Thiol-disulfide isomerase or thioredoxin [Methylomagnum ishizawai]|uniref:Thiol-disulfide isomerase or thioredoxin n=1 Tax=Methylomagnum ishizawai TaxID=1760988 RepID=A0A1Y6CW65_9GAMM|nr:TlpA disulfide reductase family protein [Methylomagnum ishizawai]SMF94490.1 Thiol-disulfide isomerase or thioredoxin [Methylomagnum ishizawai]
MKIKLGLWLAVAWVAVLAWRGFAGGVSPEVVFMSLQGERIRLGDLRGHPVLVSFWASDCRACVEEMPALAALHREYAGRGFKLVAVAMRYDVPNHVVELSRAARLPYVVALDPLGEIAAAFGEVELVPNHFLLDPQGRVVLHKLGRVSAEELSPLIEPMLGEN